jgi:predicted nucleic acid-binding protein
MILIDTSVWIDHLRKPEVQLQNLLHNDEVATHPLIRLELALSSIARREQILDDLNLLHQVPVSDSGELFALVELRKLFRRGVGITDLHLIASALLDRSISIWTRDRRLGALADELGVRAAIS